MEIWPDLARLAKGESQAGHHKISADRFGLIFGLLLSLNTDHVSSQALSKAVHVAHRTAKLL